MTALALSHPGSMAAHDDLVAAADTFDGSEAGLRALRAYAINCDMPRGVDLFAWVRDQVERYERMMGRARAETVCAAYATALDLIDSVAPSITERAA